MIKRIKDAISRWRHTRGYGVHSPFSYDVVTRAVRPGKIYQWYGYVDIHNSMGHRKDYRIEREAKMLLRLIAMLQPSAVFLRHGVHPAYHAAVRAAGQEITIYRKTSQLNNCTLLCSDNDLFSLEDLYSFLQIPGNWVAIRNLPPGWETKIFERLPEGVVFKGKNNMIAIHRSGMYKQLYRICI